MFRSHRRGTGKNLIDLYGTLARRRPDWEFVLFHRDAAPDSPLADLPNVRAVRVDIPGGDRLNLWEQVRLPLAARLAGADVLHAPANTGPRVPLTRTALTVHDLIPLEIDPDSPETRKWFRRVRAAARAARHVITPSAYSKGQIAEKLGVAPAKITVNHWAPDRGTARVTDPGAIAAVGRKYGLEPGERYAFGFGASDPRKNTRRLVEAYAGLPEALKREARLLLVGIQGPMLAEFQALAESLGVAGRVRLHGFADEPDLPALLSGADVLCFPSRSEGFGLPILDAFACGAPVLTSDRTSLPEVAGDAAILTDPDSTASIRDGLGGLLSDAGLRARLAARGRERLKLFTWERCAETVASVFERVAGRQESHAPAPRTQESRA